MGSKLTGERREAGEDALRMMCHHLEMKARDALARVAGLERERDEALDVIERLERHGLEPFGEGRKAHEDAARLLRRAPNPTTEDAA